ncbi:MAG: hypothetical protein OHK0015_38840 [Chloroflexi bacterium OHK40]
MHFRPQPRNRPRSLFPVPLTLSRILDRCRVLRLYRAPAHPEQPPRAAALPRARASWIAAACCGSTARPRILDRRRVLRLYCAPAHPEQPPRTAALLRSPFPYFHPRATSLREPAP